MGEEAARLVARFGFDSAVTKEDYPAFLGELAMLERDERARGQLEQDE